MRSSNPKLTLQGRQAVLITRLERLARKSSVDANELALPDSIPRGDAELLADAPVALACGVRVANLKRIVAADELVVDLVDEQRLVGLRGEVVVARVVAVDVAGVDGGWDGCCAVVVGEEDDVDLGTAVLAVLWERVGGDGGGQDSGESGDGELVHRGG